MSALKPCGTNNTIVNWLYKGVALSTSTDYLKRFHSQSPWQFMLIIVMVDVP